MYSSLPNKRPGRLSLMVLFFPLKGQLLILDFYQFFFFQTGTFIILIFHGIFENIEF